MYCMIHIQNLGYYCKFRHIRPYCGIFGTLCNSCIFRALPYLEHKIYSELCSCIFWHNQTLCNARILRTPAIFKILTYSEFWDILHLRHIQNHVYLDTFTHIQAYSIMIVIIILTFFFSL